VRKIRWVQGMAGVSVLSMCLLGGCGITSVANNGSGEASPECLSAEDCLKTPGDPECSERLCVNGQCQVDLRTPDHACQSHYTCWSGACCFTCVADSGETPSVVDPKDGPCMVGGSDHACGKSGGLCEDCLSQGLLCDAPFGRCFVPECQEDGECAEAPICKLSECIHGHCVIVDDTSGKECNVGASVGTCSKGKCSL